MNKYALLSIVPGLGQLYVGDKRKGILFLEVALINYVLLAMVCFSQQIAKGLMELGLACRLSPNPVLLDSLRAMHMGSAVSWLLLAGIVVFWHYAACDAQERAEGKRRKAIYRDSAIDFSEATSGSYVGHIAMSIACLLLAIMFIRAPQRLHQIIDIEFVEQQDAPRAIVKPPTNRVSTKDVEEHSRRRTHEAPRVQHQPAPQQPAASHSEPAPPTPAAPSPVKPIHMPTPPAPAVKPLLAALPAAPIWMPHAPEPVKTMSTPTLMPHPVSTPAAAPLMAPTSVSHAAALAAPTPAPMLPREDGTYPVVPTAVSGIGTAGFRCTHGGPAMPTGLRHGVCGTPSPTIVEMGNPSGASNAPPNLVAWGTGSNAGHSSGGPSAVNAVSPIRASHNGSPIAIAPVVPGGGGTSGVGSTAAPAIATSNGPDGQPTVGTRRGEPDFTEYMSNLQRLIKKHWFPPKDAESRVITVQFKISREGQMSSLHITKSSALSLADQAAVRAVEDAAGAFRPLPSGAPESVDIEFTFDYNVFTSRGRY